MLRASLALTSIALFLYFAPPAHAGSAPGIAGTSEGLVVGRQDNGIWVFEGIPYAAPPTGARRWQAPAPAPVRTDTFNALQEGPACPQPRDLPRPKSEDCLNLNIWTPGIDDARRPVMVWIHGGGFRFGSNTTNGHVFANRGAVVVSINYRLGPLGFFAHDAIDSEVANFGLLDMVHALQWVQDNIESFGGDADRVTIFGVSAGGMAVKMLMSSPLAADLFHGAIIQSGYGTWPLARTDSVGAGGTDWSGDPVPWARDESLAVVNQVNPSATTAAALRALPADQLVNALDEFQLPIVDGVSLPQEPAQVFAAGEQHDVPLITGGNSFEGTVMPGTGISMSAYQSWYAGLEGQVSQLYQDDFAISPDTGWTRMFGDQRYLLAAHIVGTTRQANAPMWMYLVDFVPTARQGEWLGTPHGVDAYFLFQGASESDPQVRALQARMANYWFAFAAHGDPSATGSNPLPWPAYEPGSRRWMVFGAGDVVRPNVLNDKLEFLAERYRARFPGVRPNPPVIIR